MNPVLDGLRGYLALANGLTDVTRERARAAAKALVAQGEAGVGAVVPPPVRAQVGALTDDLVATSRANRHLLVTLVRAEVDRSVARLGLVSAAEAGSAAQRAEALERRVAELEDELGRERARSVTTTSPGRRSSAKKATAKKSTAKRSAASKSAGKKSAAKRSAAKKKSTAKKSTAKKSTATKSTATKSTAPASGSGS